MCEDLLALTEAEPLPYVEFYIDRARALEAQDRNPDDTRAVESLSRLSAQAAAIDLRPVW
jgi:hypothetical protein